MPAKKRTPSAAKKLTAPDFQIPQSAAWLVLFLALALSVISLCTFRNMRRVAYEMSGNIQALQLRLAHEGTLLDDATAPKPEPPAPKPAIKVLTSVVKFREGEQEKLQQNLLVPILSYYESEPQPSALSAVLIERKIASSRDVNVRLFFEDGGEASYLWPSTHAKDGLWVPATR